MCGLRRFCYWLIDDAPPSISAPRRGT